MYLRLRGCYSRGRLRILGASRNLHHTPDIRSNFPRYPQKTVNEHIKEVDISENTPKVKCLDNPRVNTIESTSEPDSSHKQTCARIKLTETSQFAYKSHQSVNSDESLHLFTTNTSLNDQDLPKSKVSDIPTARKTKLSQLICGIFSDSADLAHNTDVVEQTSIDYSSLNKSLREKVNVQLDTYNKFVLLLNQHPLVVPLLLLLSLYSIIPSILPSDRQALLRTLVYHQEWTHFWNVAFVNTPTLADVEDITDLIYTEATACRYEQLAVWQALLAAHGEIDNSKLFGALCESMSYKFGLEISRAIEFCHSINLKNRTPFSDASNLPAQRALEVAVYLGSMDQEALDFKVIRTCLLKHDFAFKVQGFVSKLLQVVSHPRLIEFIVRRPTLRLNELDLYQLWHHSSLEIEQKLVVHLFRELKRNTRISESVKSSILARVVNKQLQISLADKMHSTLSQNTLIELFPLLIGSESGRRLLKKIKRTRFGSFEAAANMYIDELPKHTRDSNQSTSHLPKDNQKCLDTKKNQVNGEQMTEASAKTLEELIWILRLSSHDHCLLISKIFSALDGTKANLDAIMNIKLPVRVLLEVWNFAIKHKLLDESSSLLLFQRILQKTWDFDEMACRKEHTTFIETLDDFQRCHKNAAPNELKKLTFHLNSIALAISTSEPEYAAYVLNSIHGALLANDKDNDLALSNTFLQSKDISDQLSSALLIEAKTELTDEISSSATSTSVHTNEEMQVTAPKSAHFSCSTHPLKSEDGNACSSSNSSTEATIDLKETSDSAGMKEMPSFVVKSNTRNPRLMDYAPNAVAHEHVPPYRPCQHNGTVQEEPRCKLTQLSNQEARNNSCVMRSLSDSIEIKRRVDAGRVEVEDDETLRTMQDLRLESPSQKVQYELRVPGNTTVVNASAISNVSSANIANTANPADSVYDINVNGVRASFTRNGASNGRNNKNFLNSESQLTVLPNAGQPKFEMSERNDVRTDFHMDSKEKSTSSCLLSVEESWQKEYQEETETLEYSNNGDLDVGYLPIEDAKNQSLHELDLESKPENFSELQNLSNLTKNKKPQFTLFSSVHGRRFVMLKLIKYTMQHINEKQRDTKGIRHMGDILQRLQFDSRIGQAAVFEYMVMHQPAVSFQILHNYEANKPFLVRPLMNAVEQGILRLPRLTLEEKLQSFDKFQDLKTQLRYSAQSSRRTVTMWGELAMQEARGDREKMREIFAKALKKKIPLRVVRSWTFAK